MMSSDPQDLNATTLDIYFAAGVTELALFRPKR